MRPNICRLLWATVPPTTRTVWITLVLFSVYMIMFGTFQINAHRYSEEKWWSPTVPAEQSHSKTLPHAVAGARHEHLTPGNISICFVTAEFAETVQDIDQLPILEPNMISDPPRHFLFTNLNNFPLPNSTRNGALGASGWKKIVLSNLPYRRTITQSRWPKFLGWQHPALQHCQCSFYADAYLLNPRNESAWQLLAHKILTSSVGLMQPKQVGSNHKPVKGPVVELWKNARIGKVSWEAANATIKWLREQPDYQRNGKTPVYKNALFGYDPQNDKIRRVTLDFWETYSQEQGSWRDQSYWAYFLTKHKIRPLEFPFDPPLGPSGERGHGGHVYVNITEV